VQVQQWQHLGDLRGLAAPGRQDRRGEPTPFAGGIVDALVVDPRRPDWNRTRRHEHLPRDRVAVADHQPVTTLVQLADVRRDVGGGLGLQRGGQHPPGALADDLVDQRPAVDRLCWRILDVGDYREHGRTLPTRVSARAPLDSWTWTRREGTPPTLIHRFRALLIARTSQTERPFGSPRHLRLDLDGNRQAARPAATHNTSATAR
jgi:hypothetical protein